uniref:Recep_L_domain domain-containing protein n=1 Tax=Caenorhabditis japonica TaxID=281687 RepID=A0A8R1EAQ8_CAEJA
MDSAHSIYTILPPPANSPPTVLRYSEGLLSIKLLASPMLSYPKYLQTSKRSKALFRYGTLNKSLSIVNNSRLTSLDLPSLVKSNGKLEIVNNPVLNLRSQCSTFHSAFFNRRSVSGNEFDCGCDLIVPFKWSSVKNFPTGCVVLYGNLVLEGSAPPVEVLYRMSAVTKLYGNLEVKQTNLETLGFLQNLEEIESGT